MMHTCNKCTTIYWIPHQLGSLQPGVSKYFLLEFKYMKSQSVILKMCMHTKVYYIILCVLDTYFNCMTCTCMCLYIMIMLLVQTSLLRYNFCCLCMCVLYVCTCVCMCPCVPCACMCVCVSVVGTKDCLSCLLSRSSVCPLFIKGHLVL